MTPPYNTFYNISEERPMKVVKFGGSSMADAGQYRKVRDILMADPNLWTAETPYLYTLRTTLSRKGKTLQTFEHKFGFRELTIDGKILKLNGQPIKLRGVTCHSTDPKTAKVISDELTLSRCGSA